MKTELEKENADLRSLVARLRNQLAKALAAVARGYGEKSGEEIK